MTRYREGTSGPVTVFVPDDGSLPDQLRYTIKSLQDGYSRKETMTELRKTGLREGKARRLVQVTKPEWINQEGAIGLRQALVDTLLPSYRGTFSLREIETPPLPLATRTNLSGRQQRVLNNIAEATGIIIQFND